MSLPFDARTEVGEFEALSWTGTDDGLPVPVQENLRNPFDVRRLGSSTESLEERAQKALGPVCPGDSAQCNKKARQGSALNIFQFILKENHGGTQSTE
jgi:hypothetical protein